MRHTIINGGTGLSAVITGGIVSYMSTIEPWLRFMSLALGCIIGSISLYNLIKKKFKDD